MKPSSKDEGFWFLWEDADRILLPRFWGKDAVCFSVFVDFRAPWVYNVDAKQIS